jgi:hypothetical protein
LEKSRAKWCRRFHRGRRAAEQEESHGICQNGHLQKIGKAGRNADASTEDALLNKKAMASAEMVICRNLEKAGQNGDASTEDALLNKKNHGICRDGDD